MNKLSVVIIAHNSESVIADAVRSAAFADEVLVVDSGSDDNTVALAEKHGARVIDQPWLGFGRQKQTGVDKAKNDWIFILDSDEQITPELQSEIEDVLKSPVHKGYLVPRLNRFFGKYIRHGGLYPDRTIRLFNRKHGRFTDDEVHESVVINGKTGVLKNHMLHRAYDSIDQFIEKQNRYSSLGAKPNFLKAVVSPCWTFLDMYLFRLGFLDGKHGFIIARLYAQYTFWKYTKTPKHP